MQTQAAEHGVDQLGRAELQEEKIAFLQAGGSVEILAHGLAHGLHGRPGPRAGRADARARQATGAETLDEFLQLVDFRVRHLGRLSRGQTPGLDHGGLGPVAATAFCNMSTLPPLCLRTTSVTSHRGSPKRRSGLSEP